MNADTLRQWNEAVEAFDEKELETCLGLFQTMSNPTAFILYNSAVVLSRLGRSEEAIQRLTEALEKNGYMAIAFYRRASIYFLQQRFKEAIDDFESCGRLFQSSNHIDYVPLGLATKLFLCDVNVNCGLCYLSNGNIAKGVELLLKAQTDPTGRNSSIIAKILGELDRSKTDFSPMLVQLSDVAPLFRPRKSISEKPIDFLGKSKIIASKDPEISSNELSEGNSKFYIGLKGASDVDEASASIPPPPANPPPRRPDSPSQTSVTSTPEELHHPGTRPELPPPRSLTLQPGSQNIPTSTNL